MLPAWAVGAAMMCVVSDVLRRCCCHGRIDEITTFVRASQPHAITVGSMLELLPNPRAAMHRPRFSGMWGASAALT